MRHAVSVDGSEVVARRDPADRLACQRPDRAAPRGVVAPVALITPCDTSRMGVPLAWPLAARDLRRLGATDRRWLRLAPRAYLTGRELPPSGRFNAGQKVNARLVVFVLLVLYVSGVGN